LILCLRDDIARPYGRAMVDERNSHIAGSIAVDVEVEEQRRAGDRLANVSGGEGIVTERIEDESGVAIAGITVRVNKMHIQFIACIEIIDLVGLGHGTFGNSVEHERIVAAVAI